MKNVNLYLRAMEDVMKTFGIGAERIGLEHPISYIIETSENVEYIY